MKIRLALLLCAITVLASASYGCSVRDTVAELPNAMENAISDGKNALLDPASEVRGVWIASVYNIDFPSKTDLTAEELKSELDDIIKNCRSVGLNSIYFQVRGAADAMYASDIFPVSRFLSSNGELTIDPLEYLLKEAHRNNIRVHAWINPFRVALCGDDAASSVNTIANEYRDFIITYADGITYLDPGYPETRELISRGVREIVEKYDVDGVIIDDYFYPYPVCDESGGLAEFNDEASYRLYGGSVSRDDWRRSNVNDTVKTIYDTVKSVDAECQVGVSPFGVWQNDDGENQGSNTNGLESYSAVYCDTLAWVAGGYVDYIAPQLVWRFSDADTAFDTLVRWWNFALDGTDVDLIISHAGYRYGEGEWNSPDGEMKRQIVYARSGLGYKGSIFYGYDEIRSNTAGVADELIEAFAENTTYADTICGDMSFAIASPSLEAHVDSDYTYIIGTSDPTLPLTLDGAEVGRTNSGCFSIYVRLKNGKNLFTFSQGDREYLFVVYGGAENTQHEDKGYAYLSAYQITEQSVLGGDVYNCGERITLYCTAPSGSEVYAVIGELSVKMYQLDRPEALPNDSGYAEVRFCADIVLPVIDDGAFLDMGELIYTALLDSRSACVSGGNVRIFG